MAPLNLYAAVLVWAVATFTVLPAPAGWQANPLRVGWVLLLWLLLEAGEYAADVAAGAWESHLRRRRGTAVWLPDATGPVTFSGTPQEWCEWCRPVTTLSGTGSGRFGRLVVCPLHERHNRLSATTSVSRTSR